MTWQGEYAEIIVVSERNVPNGDRADCRLLVLWLRREEEREKELLPRAGSPKTKRERRGEQ